MKENLSPFTAFFTTGGISMVVWPNSDNWNTLLKCGNLTNFNHTLNIKHESSAGFCNFYHYPKEWNWYKCLFIYQSRHYFELFDQRVTKTEEMSLFSSGPFEKLDQNKLLKVSTKQWCYHVCYCLENKQELPNTARALPWVYVIGIRNLWRQFTVFLYTSI